MTQQTAVDLQTYSIDPAHSRMGFTVRHMGFSKVRGSFEQFEGTVRIAAEDISTLEASATIKSETITTNDQNRDTHLRSEDFFQVEKHPTITFKSREVRNVSGNRFVLVGDFTLRGVTRQIELKAEYLGSGTDPWGGKRVAFEGTTTINRKEFGLNWNALLETGGFLVSEEVEISLEVQASLQTGDN
jgi:polyisoprenoid-binding protein YceI